MRNDFTSGYLAHHGILGQKHGQRNGPPYPLDAEDHSSSEKKAGWRQSLKDKKVAKKKAKQRQQALEKARKVRAEKAKQAQIKKEFEEKKQHILQSGKASEVQKYKGQMSNEELQRAIDRINKEAVLDALASREIKTGFDKLDRIKVKADKIAGYMESGKKVYNLLAEVHNAVTKDDPDTKKWPKIGGGDNNDKKDKK